MLLGWRCCYIQFVVTLKMLLRWRCCYVQVVLGLKRKQTHVHFAHGSLVDYDMFMSITRNLKIQKTPNFFGKRNNIIYKLMNLKKTKQRWNSGQHIPDMLSACWANCWYSQVIGRTQNTVKHSENEIFQTGQQWTSIALRGTPSLYPLYPVYIYLSIYIYKCDHMLYVERDLEPQTNRNKCCFSYTPMCYLGILQPRRWLVSCCQWWLDLGPRRSTSRPARKALPSFKLA